MNLSVDLAIDATSVSTDDSSHALNKISCKAASVRRQASKVFVFDSRSIIFGIDLCAYTVSVASSSPLSCIQLREMTLADESLQVLKTNEETYVPCQL